jgi:hypothetical protein
MGAISLDQDSKSVVNQEECVECSTCCRVLTHNGRWPWLVRGVRWVLSLFHLAYLARVDECPTGALAPPLLEWPRSVRAVFSDPSAVHQATGVAGRGTEEIKTNDVTGRLQEGEVGFVIELGRPGVGARFRDVERIAMAIAPLQVDFEANNPVTQLMQDPQTGKIREDVLDEKVLSAIIEIKTVLDRIPEVLSTLERAQEETDAVFSLGIASKCLADGSIPHEEWVERAGYSLSSNGKTNLGLGRPRFERG